MASRYLATKQKQFKAWWHSPATRADRVISSILGAWAFLIMGLIAGFMSAPDNTLSLVALGYWAIGSATTGSILGAIFPKAMRCVTIPFAFIGIGGGGST